MTNFLFPFSARRRSFLALCFLAVIPFLGQAEETYEIDDLYGQIESLQGEMNIQITGLEKIGDEGKVRVSGSLDQQLQQALASYNHVISRNTEGRIEKIVIIGKKEKTDDGRIILPARYEDGHFVVSVSVSGHGKFWETLDMIIDTGADLVVLPESMIDGLGLSDDALTAGKMQTANGQMDARIGKLQEVRIAGEILNDVPAAFVEDDRLANKSLLGMSALGRYKLIIDNESQSVTLLKK
ncbi:MAG: retropepsin-like aspartic protease family protein [Gammaproteobacteria bacterium]